MLTLYKGNLSDIMNDERNRLIWIITDTILNVKGVSEEEKYYTLCKNLRFVCNADIACLFTFDIENRLLSINAFDTSIASVYKKLKPVQDLSINAGLTIIEELRKRNISYGKDFDVFQYFNKVLSKENKNYLAQLSLRYKVYNISTIQQDNIGVIGTVYLNPNERLHMMDLIGSYINLAGMILNDSLIFNKLEKKNEELSNARESLEIQQEKLSDQATELEEANEKLSELNSTKDKFFSIIAHDLKNPFHYITGFSEVLLNSYDKLSEDKIKSYLECIWSSSKNSFSLLENLLQWARSQSQRIEYLPEVFDISNLIRKNIEFVADALQKKKILLTDKTISDTFIFADKNMMNTVIRNILSNAIKFTPEKGKITLECRERNGHIELDIADTGIGMNNEEVKKLFRIDQSFSKTGTSGESGTGLGLILCKEFIEKNGGEIKVMSQSGVGTKFSIYLPINQK